MTEDAATVLEDWVQTVANLPAEIQHVLEEIQAKDKVTTEYRTQILVRDNSIQKHVKANGCGVPHPKEAAHCKAVLELFEKASVLQSEKVALGDRAASLLDRQIKRLDVKIRDLQNEGSIQPDPQLPSLLTNHSVNTRLPPMTSISTGVNSSASLNSLHPSATGNSSTIANSNIQRLVQLPANNRQQSPLSTAAAIQAHNIAASRQNARSPSVDNPNSKRRRLNQGGHLNAPATSSSLRQSSLGPGTPRTGLDGTARGSSAGPLARPSKKGANVRGASVAAAGGGAGGPAAVPQRVNHLNPTSGNKKPGPAARRRNARQKSGTPASTKDEDVVMHDGNSEDAEGDEDDVMDGAGEREDGEGEDDDEDEGEGDDRKYCTCRSVSYGNMVACDNDDCPYEWFHWSCVGITSEPKGKWFCPECRPRK